MHATIVSSGLSTSFRDELYKFVRDVSSDKSLGRRLCLIPVATLEQAADLIAAPFEVIERVAHAAIALVRFVVYRSSDEFRNCMYELDKASQRILTFPLQLAMAPMKILYQVATAASRRFRNWE